MTSPTKSEIKVCKIVLKDFSKTTVGNKIRDKSSDSGSSSVGDRGNRSINGIQGRSNRPNSLSVNCRQEFLQQTQMEMKIGETVLQDDSGSVSARSGSSKDSESSTPSSSKSGTSRISEISDDVDDDMFIPIKMNHINESRSRQDGNKVWAGPGSCKDSESTRSSSSMSGTSSSLISEMSDDVDDDMFVPVKVNLQNESRRKRTYERTISDDRDFVPATVRKIGESIESYESSESEEQEEEFAVEKIVGMRIDRGQKYYHVKWKGYSSQHNTWEPESNMTRCQELIDEYLKILKKRPVRPTKPRITVAKKGQQAPTTLMTSVSNTCGHFVLQKATSSTNTHTPVTAVKHSRLSESISEAEVLGEPYTIIDHQTPFEILVPETVIEVEKMRILNSSSEFLFRLWDNNQVYLLQLDISQNFQADICYNLIISENIRCRTPTWIYGASLDVYGNVYCLVKFKGMDYVDIVPPKTLFRAYPKLLTFYTNNPKYRDVILKAISCP